MEEPIILGMIEITAIPQGDLPEVVRMQWFGLMLPFVHYGQAETYGVISGKLQTTCRNGCLPIGFSVPGRMAIEKLAVLQPQTAQIWIDRGFNTNEQCFFFEESCAKVISGTLPPFVITEVTDEMDGDPYR